MTKKKSRKIYNKGWATVILSTFLIIVAGIIVYSNSFKGPFIFDDKLAILDNTYIHHPWPLWRFIVGTARPITDISFAINYALGGD